MSFVLSLSHTHGTDSGTFLHFTFSALSRVRLRGTKAIASTALAKKGVSTTWSLLPGAVANVQVRLSEAAVGVEGLAQMEALAVLEGEHQVDLG